MHPCLDDIDEVEIDRLIHVRNVGVIRADYKRCLSYTRSCVVTRNYALRSMDAVSALAPSRMIGLPVARARTVASAR
jgi:hypothetical protein